MAARPADGTGLFDQPGASAAVEEFCSELNQGLDYALQVEWDGDDADRFFRDDVAHYFGQRNVVPDPDYRQGQHRERRPGEPAFRNFDVDVTATADGDLGATAAFERVTDRAFGLRHAHLVFVYSTGTADELRAIAEDRRVPAEGVLSVRPAFRWTVSYEPYPGRSRTPDRRPSAEVRNDVTDVYPRKLRRRFGEFLYVDGQCGGSVVRDVYC